MGTRMKLLTVGVVLVTAAVAGCSSTTAGSSGAIQNDVTLAPAASSAASTAPAPSPDPVTPTAEPTEAPASPVASPTDSPALLGGQSNPNCDKGLKYACGDKGPGGGKVFYAKSTPFSLSGGYTTAACGNNNCQYMEMRRLDQPPMSWCVGPGASTSISPATGTAIGTGYSNTQTMATGSGPNGQYCISGAANAAIASTSGGYTDWYVPSADEAQASCSDGAGGNIWTSSQSNNINATVNNCGKNSDRAKTNDFTVSMVRAF
jgi:hypothetical protein